MDLAAPASASRSIPSGSSLPPLVSGLCRCRTLVCLPSVFLGQAVKRQSWLAAGACGAVPLGRSRLFVEPLEERRLLAVTTFSNTAAIEIPAAGTDGIAGPYPSTITVSGLSGLVRNVSVTLKDFSHTFSDDVGRAARRPAGQNLVLLSDVGGNIASSGLTITLDDAAAGQLADATALSSGTFRPTNFDSADRLPRPGARRLRRRPAWRPSMGPTPMASGVCYVVDDNNSDTGRLAGGWSLAIETTVGGRPGVQLGRGGRVRPALERLESADRRSKSGAVAGPAKSGPDQRRRLQQPERRRRSALPSTSPAGSFSLAGGIQFIGGGGTDRLRLIGNGATTDAFLNPGARARARSRSMR